MSSWKRGTDDFPLFLLCNKYPRNQAEMSSNERQAPHLVIISYQKVNLTFFGTRIEVRTNIVGNNICSALFVRVGKQKSHRQCRNNINKFVIQTTTNGLIMSRCSNADKQSALHHSQFPNIKQIKKSSTTKIKLS